VNSRNGIEKVGIFTSLLRLAAVLGQGIGLGLADPGRAHRRRRANGRVSGGFDGGGTSLNRRRLPLSERQAPCWSLL